MTSPIIQAQKLSYFFGRHRLRKQVLIEIDLVVEPSEVVFLMGPSGCGKTTLLTLVGGLRSPQKGSLQVLGYQLKGASEKVRLQVRRKVGFIFQSSNLVSYLNAQENVQMAIDVCHRLPDSVAKKRASLILSLVGLESYVNHYPHQLSGGQKQRVAIARALVNQPQVLLADEPTAALDKQRGREVVELMKNLAQQQGCAVLMVTHDNRVLDIANRVVEMEDGYLIQDRKI